MNKQERRIYNREWRKQNLEKVRAYDREWKREAWKKNPEKHRTIERKRWKRLKAIPEWHEKHKAYMRAYLKKWRKDNPKQSKRHRDWMRVWYKKNGKKIYKKRMSKLHERIAANIRSRIISALKGKSKSARTEKLLGITIRELKVYLEGKFQQGMTWENYGFYGWHCDHIIPLCNFDLANPNEQKKAFHYTNLQPLWAKDNLRKYKKLLVK